MEYKSREELASLVFDRVRNVPSAAKIERIYICDYGNGDWDFGVIWGSRQMPPRNEVEAVVAALHEEYALRH